MAHTKERLIELIEAYAAAKVSNNTTLVSLVAASLQQMLLSVTFADPPSDPVVIDDFTLPDEVPQAPARRTRKAAE